MLLRGASLWADEQVSSAYVCQRGVDASTLASLRQPELVADLEQDPFVSSALQTACCELYYRYGMYLAPLTTAVTTVKHCD